MRSAILAIPAAFILFSACSSSPPIKPNDTSTTPQATASAAPPKKEEKKVSANGKEMRCALGKDERIVMLEPNPPGCEVYYTKGGSPDPKVIAASKKSTSYCEGVFERVRKNLTSGGFTCK
jgi:hypothetical protein